MSEIALEIFIVWVVLAIIAWIIAVRKGYSGFTFFVTSICLTPIVGLTAAVIAKSKVGTLKTSPNSDKPPLD